MFTGLVEELGILRSVRKGPDSALLNVEAKNIFTDLKIGDSVAVNGVCLTVTSYEGQCFTADVMSETLAKSNLGELKSGDRVNLERALRLGDRLGGHLVSGHIDGVGTITNMERFDIATLITISAPKEVMRYIIKKGSVAVDGTSLTVVDFAGDKFTVSLIPHTAHATTLGYKKRGASVNLEADIVGKYIERLLGSKDETVPNAGNSGLSLEFLMKNGFV
jgi:riboflavin synthase